MTKLAQCLAHSKCSGDTSCCFEALLSTRPGYRRGGWEQKERMTKSARGVLECFRGEVTLVRVRAEE